MNEALVEEMRQVGVRRGDLVGLAIQDDRGCGLAAMPDGRIREWGLAIDDTVAAITAIERELRPRWVWWTGATAAALLRHGVHVARCWDVAAVHRLQFGGYRADPALVWAALHGHPSASIPTPGRLELGPSAAGTSERDDPDDPDRGDGHLRPEWVASGWADSVARLGRWAAVAVRAQQLQAARLATLARDRPAIVSTVHSESAAELLAVELAHGGLPVDRRLAEKVITRAIGPRAADAGAAARERERRDEAVLRHAPLGGDRDLRNPAHVRELLRRVGVEVPDTRAWRLEAMRDAHPLVEALLAWRKQERIATTYGYAWLDRHVAVDGRLRGEWSACDGAAGRMTASAGLHNLPTEMRELVVAEAGHVFVRADLGQIEPRVLAAVSGDAALARATQSDDLYAPVAARLGVERSSAKVAVLAAMYGQTSGTAGAALRGMERAYPVAIEYLRAAADAAARGIDLRTYGGRLLSMSSAADDRMPGIETSEDRRVTAARARYGRNAMVQGAAAELFKAWAVTVRARTMHTATEIVLCLHDELLVHTPQADAEATVRLVRDTLDEAAFRWAPEAMKRTVRFIADVSAIERWSQAK